MRAALSAQKNKTDRNDACAIAQIVRTGWYQPVHIKSRQAHEIRVLLTNRRMLSNQRQAIDNELQGILRNFGQKVGKVGRGRGAPDRGGFASDVGGRDRVRGKPQPSRTGMAAGGW